MKKYIKNICFAALGCNNVIRRGQLSTKRNCLCVRQLFVPGMGSPVHARLAGSWLGLAFFLAGGLGVDEGSFGAEGGE